MKDQPRQESRTKPHLLNLTLAGLPELEHFETDSQRQAALHEIGQEAGDVRRGGFWLAILTLAGVVIAWQFVVRWIVAKIYWPKWLEDILVLVAMGGVFFVTLRFLHRSGAATELRGKLLRDGVPVCIKCGYLLRGLPLEPGRCPECGRAFDPRIREILTASQDPLFSDPRRNEPSVREGVEGPPAA